MVIILTVLVFCLFGWGYKLYKDLEKIKNTIGLNPQKVKFKEEGLKEVSFSYVYDPWNVYKIRAKVLKEVGNQYLVQYVESYPHWKSTTHSPFNNNRLLIDKSKILK